MRGYENTLDNNMHRDCSEHNFLRHVKDWETTIGNRTYGGRDNTGDTAVK